MTPTRSVASDPTLTPIWLSVDAGSTIGGTTARHAANSATRGPASAPGGPDETGRRSPAIRSPGRHDAPSTCSSRRRTSSTQSARRRLRFHRATRGDHLGERVPRQQVETEEPEREEPGVVELVGRVEADGGRRQAAHHDEEERHAVPPDHHCHDADQVRGEHPPGRAREEEVRVAEHLGVAHVGRVGLVDGEGHQPPRGTVPRRSHPPPRASRGAATTGGARRGPTGLGAAPAADPRRGPARRPRRPRRTVPAGGGRAE